MSSATDTITILGKALAVDTVTLEDGTAALVVRDKIGFGIDGSYVDVNATNPLPVKLTGTGAAIALDQTTLTALEQTTISGTVALDQATLDALEATTVTVNGIGGLATQTTLAQVLAALQSPSAPSGAGDVASTLADGRKTVATPGVNVAAIGSSTPCKWVTITALPTNVGQVNVGGSAVSAVAGSESGTPLLARDGITIPVNNLNKVFIDARVAGDGITYTVGS